VSKISRLAGRKAAKATVKHSVHGATAKAQRKPLRSVTLLLVGGVLGLTAGWVAGRKAGGTA
jgi:hypothetical protein